MGASRITSFVLVGLCLATGCSTTDAETAPAESTVETNVSTVNFNPEVCGNGFRAMELDHIVKVADPESMFDANGAGVAIGDLDGDQRPDVVLGNLNGPVRIFWNMGAMEFRSEELIEMRSRAIQLVDFDGDQDLDVALAPGFGPPIVMINKGGSFSPGELQGVEMPAYSMQWLDPDGDDDLDVVIASYDMEFGELIAREFINDTQNGVWFYEQDRGRFTGTQLAPTSHALAMTTADFDSDGDDDLIVGNDYGLPDSIWLWDGGWESDDSVFETTAANTMSFDVGDVDGDGDDDLFATDMAPFDDSNAEFWEMMSGVEHDPPGPQIVENVLLDLGDDGFPNRAGSVGVNATGWSWSGRLADLDHDTDLDLYVANGMLPSPLMVTVPNSVLTEPNLAYRNDGTGRFHLAADWALASKASTRGVAFGDLDGDGDLDMVASTVDAPALVYVNEICEGRSLVVEARRPGGGVIFGTRITVVSEGAGGEVRQTRTLRSGTAYLSADEPIAHVGLGDGSAKRVEIRWPDGEYSIIDQPGSDVRIVVSRAES